MSPAPGERAVRFVGDTLRLELRPTAGGAAPDGFRARLRTTIGRGSELRREIRDAHFHNVPPAGRAWRDLELEWQNGAWVIDLPLAEVGFFRAKAYAIDAEGRLHWPSGDDFGLTIQPDWCRTANTIYCAFPRQFGPNKSKTTTVDTKQEAAFKKLDEQGFTVIPPSGTLRDLQTELPHIFDTLGCRVLHLLPVSPTPTTLAKFGRFGSPYALQDLTAIDPALVEFDQRTTGVQQFEELTDAVHLRDGRVILDLVINHTGWHSTLFEQHPEWFVRNAEGRFVSPGAWGNTWEDLVEIDPASTALWDELAGAFLVWCRRGVDGFRCDAGYKVPTLVWQYITARVHEEYPETVFLLEGLGGGWDDTAIRLTEGGMQWAYSELFQNYSAAELCGYLAHTWKESERVGLLVHYSETHDNDRLAKKGRAWSLLRNRLCALASVSGGFGFTNGVEWLAAEQVNVHSSRGLSWGSKDNIITELADLNRLLAEHPCFFDGAKLTRLSNPKDSLLAFMRETSDGQSRVLVLINPEVEKPGSVQLPKAIADQIRSLKPEAVILGKASDLKTSADSSLDLLPGAAICMELIRAKEASAGAAYRTARSRAAFAHRSSHAIGVPLKQRDWMAVAESAANPASLIASLAAATAGGYPTVVRWTAADKTRIAMVPPGHWLLIRLPHRFRCRIQFADGTMLNLEATPGDKDWFAAIPPQSTDGDALLAVKLYSDTVERLQGTVRYLKTAGEWHGSATGEPLNHWAAERTVLLTNGQGAMARINLDLGRVRSKYDCILGANLHDSLPVDRHVLLKRLRLWANADGFVVPLNAANLVGFKLHEPDSQNMATWQFRVQAGGGRSVTVRMDAWMFRGGNAVAFELCREKTRGPGELPLRLTARFDLEDRNFHWETKRNESADHHFTANTKLLGDRAGFTFRPAADRPLDVWTSDGTFHLAPEWSENLPHPVEASRGQTGSGDGWSPGWFDLPLPVDGESILLAASAELPFSDQKPPPEVLESLMQELLQKTEEAMRRDPRTTEDKNQLRPATFAGQLQRAASQFIVRRGDFKSVIAGYPWFLDWGRDTLICARGLVAGGWTEEVKQLLIVFGRFEENGTLPNTIHGADASNRDTSDAPLWYGVVAEDLAAAVGDDVFATRVDGRRTVHDVLISIANGYLNGTSNGIRVDRESGLVWSPSHFTWMDTNYPAGTPREGYPIEIQALWIRLLRTLAGLDTTGEWQALADLATRSLDSFYWLEEKGWFADSLIAGAGIPAARAVKDQVLRSNCLFVISLGLLSGERARRCVEAARDHLVIPGAIRSLAPLPAEPPLPVHAGHGALLNDPQHPYWGRYEGDEDTRRKPAYHNGTAWTWPFPVFCEALALAYEKSPAAVAAAKAYLGSMDRLLEEGCIGQLPEVIDGDAPHQQRGCDAQAWGATEALRVHRWLEAQPKSTVAPSCNG